MLRIYNQIKQKKTANLLFITIRLTNIHRLVDYDIGVLSNLQTKELRRKKNI